MDLPRQLWKEIGLRLHRSRSQNQYGVMTLFVLMMTSKTVLLCLLPIDLENRPRGVRQKENEQWPRQAVIRSWRASNWSNLTLASHPLIYYKKIIPNYLYKSFSLHDADQRCIRSFATINPTQVWPYIPDSLAFNELMMSHIAHTKRCTPYHDCPQYRLWGFEVSASITHKLYRREERHQPPSLLPKS